MKVGAALESVGSVAGSGGSGGSGAGFGSSEEREGHEWELGIGELIIDLDADIEKSGGGGGAMATAKEEEDGIRMRIKRKNGGREVKHEVVNMSTSSHKKKKKEPVQPAAAATVASVGTMTEGTMTESEWLGPCEPGTSVTLDGVVWHETDGGVLVVNVTWREKSYVGTLLDCTRHDWAPPRLCDSPADAQCGGVHSAAQQLDDKTSAKRKPRQGLKCSLRSKPTGRRTANSSGQFAVPPSPGKSAPVPCPAVLRPHPALIECPEPNCNKKYKHINGLKYHQTHAHSDKTPLTPVKAESPPSEPAAPAPPVTAAVTSDSDTTSVEQQAEASAAPADGPVSSPAYSDISDANDESEEGSPVEQSQSSQSNSQPAATPAATEETDSKGGSFSTGSLCFAQETSDEAAAAAGAASFPYPYSYLPACAGLPENGTAGGTGGEASGVCATMETTGPPPAAPTSSYYLHPHLAHHYPHFDPVFHRMYPHRGDKSAGDSESVEPEDSGSRSPPTQRHLHTHHHTHVAFPSYHHPIAAFPILTHPPPVPPPPAPPAAPSFPASRSSK